MDSVIDEIEEIPLSHKLFYANMFVEDYSPTDGIIPENERSTMSILQQIDIDYSEMTDASIDEAFLSAIVNYDNIFDRPGQTANGVRCTCCGDIIECSVLVDDSASEDEYSMNGEFYYGVNVPKGFFNRTGPVHLSCLGDLSDKHRFALCRAISWRIILENNYEYDSMEDDITWFLENEESDIGDFIELCINARIPESILDPTELYSLPIDLKRKHEESDNIDDDDDELSTPFKKIKK